MCVWGVCSACVCENVCKSVREKCVGCMYYYDVVHAVQCVHV